MRNMHCRFLMVKGDKHNVSGNIVFDANTIAGDGSDGPPGVVL